MKFKMKSMTIISLMLILVLVLTACGNGKDSNDTSKGTDPKTNPAGGTYSEKDAEHVIKVSVSSKASEKDRKLPGTVALNEFKAYVEEKSEGKVFVKMFYGGQLASSNEDRVNGLKTGAFEMEFMNTGSWSEYTDTFTALNAPYLFLNADIANKTIEGPLGDRMNEQLLADTGIRNLGYVNLGYRQLTNSKREVKSPKDVSGLKIRTMSDPYQIETWKALGASVTPTSYSELYTALQQGMVDGQENPLTNIYTSGMYEIQPYLTLTNHNCSFVAFVINDKFYQSLPKEYQEIVDGAGKHAVEASKEVFEAAEEELIELVSEKCEVYRPSMDELKVFKEATNSVREVMLKNEIGQEYYDFVLESIAEAEKELGY